MGEPRWTVGQTVVVVEPGQREARVSDGEITRVGRKWVTVSLGKWRTLRFDFAGLGEADYGYRARMYADRAAHDASVARNRAWNDFRALLNRIYGAPEHLSADDIAAMTSKLQGLTND